MCVMQEYRGPSIYEGKQASKAKPQRSMLGTQAKMPVKGIKGSQAVLPWASQKGTQACTVEEMGRCCRWGGKATGKGAKGTTKGVARHKAKSQKQAAKGRGKGRRECHKVRVAGGQGKRAAVQWWEQCVAGKGKVCGKGAWVKATWDNAGQGVGRGQREGEGESKGKGSALWGLGKGRVGARARARQQGGQVGGVARQARWKGSGGGRQVVGEGVQQQGQGQLHVRLLLLGGQGGSR